MEKSGTVEKARPPVSVVICTAGRIRHLPRTVESIRQQTYRPLEIVLVVGPSTDATDQYAATLSDVKVLKVDRLNLSYARNVGIRAAGGEFVAFIDDDAVPAPRWLEETVRLFQEEGPSCGGIGGAVINESARSRPLQFRHGLVSELGEIDDIRLEPGEANSPAGPWFNRVMGTNMTFRRSALLAIGGFDETFEYTHDETDVCIALIRCGYRIVHHGRAIVHHFPARSHNRRGEFDFNWYSLLKNNMYFALKHSQRSTTFCVRTTVRRYRRLLKEFVFWTLHQHIPMRKGLHFTREWLRGFWTGLKLGTQRRRLGVGIIPMIEERIPSFRPIDDPVPAVLVRTPRSQRSLRIGLVCSEYGTANAGGIATYTQHLAESLADLGHSVVVVRAGWSHCPSQPRKYQVVDTSPSLTNTTCHQTAVFEALYRAGVDRPFDIVEAPLWAGEACAVGMGLKCPLVVRLETPFEVVRALSGLPLDRSALDMIRSERLQLSHAAGAIAISRAIWQTIEEVYEVKLQTHARKASIVPLGLPSAACVPMETIGWLPAGGGPKFLYLGRLETRKGIIEIGKAFAEVARKLPTATLWIAGSDNSAHDGFSQRTGHTYADWLCSLWGPEISSRVQLFGAVSEGVKNFLYSRCDVAVVPSRYESFGLVLLEAMRFGKPVVATDVGGIPEIVKDGETGLLVPVESIDRLIVAMTAVGTDKKLRRRLGEAGRQRFEQEFSLHRCALRTEVFYRQILAAWDGKPDHEVIIPAHEVIGRVQAA